MKYIHNKAGNFQCFCLSENQNLSKSKHFEIVVTFCLEFSVFNSVTFFTNLNQIRQPKLSNCNKKLISLLAVKIIQNSKEKFSPDFWTNDDTINMLRKSVTFSKTNFVKKKIREILKNLSFSKH